MAFKGSTTVGIDIGTADSIIAYVCKNGVDVVQNEVSSRKTPTVVGFNDRERLLGDSAQVVQKSNFKNTYSHIFSLLCFDTFFVFLSSKYLFDLDGYPISIIIMDAGQYRE